jgi:glycolate oxidase FAD binding subunit
MAVRTSDTIVSTALDEWGRDGVRVIPRPQGLEGPLAVPLLMPTDAATAAAMLRWAGAHRLAVTPTGAGTKLFWGSSATRVDALLTTTHLESRIDHCAGDLTAILPSGVSLRSVNDALGRQGQWLPLDPSFSSRATIGGIVATHDSGPRRHRYGTPRDLIIGIEMALPDGRVAKAGGRVVKNVAGYDLSRLLCGSFGSLAVITSATFKLAPLPAASRTVVATAPSIRPLVSIAMALGAAPLAPAALDLEAPPFRLLIRFETTEAAADRQAASARAICDKHGAATEVVGGAPEADLWEQRDARFWGGALCVAKISALPTDLADALQGLQADAAARRVDCRLMGRAALGVFYCRLDGAADAQATILSGLRSVVSRRGGSVVVLIAPPDVKAQVAPWGDIGNALRVMQAVKGRFDPNGTLNPGGGPGGL